MSYMSPLYQLIYSLSYISQCIAISLSQLSRTLFISSEVAILSFKRRSQHLMLHILLETPFQLKNLPHSHPDPFPSSSTRATRPLQLVHSDVHGPVKVSTHQGYCYWVSFIDDFSCFKAVYLLKCKSETFDDKGGEYMSREFEAFCIDLLQYLQVLTVSEHRSRGSFLIQTCLVRLISPAVGRK